MRRVLFGAVLMACAMPAFGQNARPRHQSPASQPGTPGVARESARRQLPHCQPAIVVPGVPGALVQAPAPPTASGIGSMQQSGIGMMQQSGVGMMERSGVGAMERSGVGTMERSGVGAFGSFGIGMLPLSQQAPIVIAAPSPAPRPPVGAHAAPPQGPFAPWQPSVPVNCR